MLDTIREAQDRASGLGDHAPALDPQTLQANTMGDPALQRELFDLYFGYARQTMGRLADALERGDAKAWMDGAHGLKGTARTLGLIRLADLSAEAQFAAEAGPSGVTADRFTAIEDALVDAMSAAHAYLAQSLAKAS